MDVAFLNDSELIDELQDGCVMLVEGGDRYIPTIAVDFSSLGGRSPVGGMLTGQLWLAEVVAELEDEGFGRPHLTTSEALETFLTDVVSVQTCVALP